MRILVVEDQTDLATQIVKRFDRAGYSVDAVGTLSDARALDSQSVKSAEKGGLASIRTATMPEKRSRARSGTFSSIR